MSLNLSQELYLGYGEFSISLAEASLGLLH